MVDQETTAVASPVPTASGERFIPGTMSGEIELEHIHRYRFAAQLGVKKTVLDIASGEGYGSAFLSHTAKRVIGVDISAPVVEAARQHYRHPNLEFLVGSCSNIPLADSTIDVVVSFETIEHHAEHDAMMREIKRVLRPRGLLIISTPDKLEYSDKPAFHNPFHVKELYREDFRSLLTAHFKSVRMFGQRVLEASALFSERSGHGIVFDDLRVDSTPQPHLPSPKYLLAVASNGKIPALSGGLLEKPLAPPQPELANVESKLSTLVLRAISAANSKVLRTALSGPWYLEGNTDIAAGSVDPYAHWMKHGAALSHQRDLSVHVERARMQGREELEESLRTLAERERAVTENLLLQQKLAGEERDAQRETAAERLQELATQHREREEALRAQLAERERDLRHVHADAQEHQRRLEGQLEKVRLEYHNQLEAQLRSLAERERVFAEKMLSQRNSAAEEMNAQRETAEAQLRALTEQHFDREEALGAQLAERDRELRQLHVAAQDTQRTFEGELRAVTDRERTTTEHLLQQLKANADQLERQRVSASEELRALSVQHHERERVLLAAIADKERDLRNIHRESAEQRKDFEATIGQRRVAVQYAVASQRAADIQQLHSLNAQHNRDIEQNLLAMVERERAFAKDFSGVNDLIAEERRLLRDQYLGMSSYIRNLVNDMRGGRFWRRAALGPTRIDLLWDSARAPTYSLQDWISMRKPTLEKPNQGNLNAPTTAADTAGLYKPGEQGERTALRAKSRARTIEELLAWDGHDFVTCTYLTLLGRKPDKEGYSFYMDHLLRNNDKGTIIRQISDSREAKRRSIHLKGLTSFLRRQRWGRIPILRALTGRYRRDSLDHQLRLVLDEIAHAIGTLEQGISGRISRFESEQLPGAAAQINALFKSFDAEKYIAANPDVGASGVNPFEHFLRHGWYENRHWPGRSRLLEAADAVGSTPEMSMDASARTPPSSNEPALRDSSRAPPVAGTELSLHTAENKWSCVMEPALETPNGDGPVITRLMHFIWRSRPDLRRAYDVHHLSGQLDFIKWLALHGLDELALTANVFPRSVLERLSRAGTDWDDTARRLLQEQDVTDRSSHRADSERGEYAATGHSAAVGANLIGYAYGEFGMGEHARMLARSLNSLDIPFCLIDQDAGFHGTGDASVAAWVQSEPRFDTNIFLVNADVFPFLPFRLGTSFASRRYNVAYWAWELSQWPAEFELALDMVDEVWAISDFVAESVRSKARIPVVPMHVVVSAPDLGPGYTKSRYGVPEDSFVFYFIFDAASHLDRKNPVGVVKAFEEAFPDGEARVHLLMKTMNVETAGPLWDQLLKEVTGNPRITILSHRMSREDVLGLNVACDAFVSLHRSEGFGRCVAEAMAYGKPVIVTDYSGTRDFATADTACLVNYRLIAVPDGAYPFCEGQVWADPDTAHAASLMQRIASDDRYRTDIALAGQKFIRENYNQEAMARQYAKRLHDIHILTGALSHASDCETQEQAASAQVLQGNIDSPSDEQCREVSDVIPVEGWVASSDPINIVRIYVDSAFIGNANYGIPRPDIHAAFPQFPDAGRSGFCYLLNIAALADGEHSFSVVAECRNGSSRQWTIPFSKKESFSYQEWLRNTEALYARTTSVRRLRPRDLRMSLVLRCTLAVDVSLLMKTLSSLASQQDTRFELLVLLEEAAQESVVTQITSQAFPNGKIRFVVGRGGDWDLLLANCRAELIGLVDPGDLFTPWAFRELIASVQEGGQVDLVYADEDSCGAGSSRPSLCREAALIIPSVCWHRPRHRARFGLPTRIGQKCRSSFPQD